MDDVETSWLAELQARHTASLTRPELLKAIRALSARYVERRDQLPGRSPLDSAGKRAAFATFYAPLHYVTVQGIAGRLPAPPTVTTIVDLGCGTGAASAAWARSFATPPDLRGIDRHPWAVDEANWTWNRLQLHGRAQRGDLVEEVRRHVGSRRAADLAGTAFLCAWSVNELEKEARARLLPLLIDAARRGATVLVVEPIARSATPWWREWSQVISNAGGRDDDWRFDAPLPARLADLDEAAGFARDGLSAKSLFLTAMG
jgi:SAM-dependent methyltransferase